MDLITYEQFETLRQKPDCYEELRALAHEAEQRSQEEGEAFYRAVSRHFERQTNWMMAVAWAHVKELTDRVDEIFANDNARIWLLRVYGNYTAITWQTRNSGAYAMPHVLALCDNNYDRLYPIIEDWLNRHPEHRPQPTPKEK